MDRDSFEAANTVAGSAAEIRAALADATRTDAAFFKKGRTLYYALRDDAPYDPIFKLFGSARKRAEITSNYDARSESVAGVLQLQNSTATFKRSPSLPGRVDTYRRCDVKVADQLRNLYRVPERPGGIVSDIQAESASVRTDSGGYKSCGNRTVHRLYLATAYVILRKLHSAGSRDGVVAIVADRNGRVVSWGRKNPDVGCWHGETSAIMRLGGTIPSGSCVYSTLKPCNMCAGLINDASGGNAKVFWGQDDPGAMAAKTILESKKTGALLDGNKSHAGARGILLNDKSASQRPVMAEKLGSSFKAQKKRGLKSTIDYIVSPGAEAVVCGAEAMLKTKHAKYADPKRDVGNENTRFAVAYLIEFLGLLNLQVDGLGA